MCATINPNGGKAMRDKENNIKWRKENLVRYEFTLNKATNKKAFDRFTKIINKRAYLIDLIEKDADENER